MLRDEGLFSSPSIQVLDLNFSLARIPSAVDERAVQWEVWDGVQAAPITPSSDGTANLSRTGVVEFRDLSGFLAVPAEKRWLRCRLVTPITPGDVAQANMVRETRLPTIQSNCAASGHQPG